MIKALKEAPGAVPYGELTVRILMSVFDGLKICSERYLHDKPLEATDAELDKCFKWLNPSPHSRLNRNKHLLEGIGRRGDAPRLAALTVWRFKEIQRSARYSQNRDVVGLMLPSPLSILYDALIVPDEPASKGFALAACRRLLFIRHLAYPSRQATGAGWKYLDVDEIETELDAQRRYFEHRDNIPPAQNRTAEVLQHFFAMKGHYCLRFGTWNKKNVGDREALWKLVDAYLSQRDLTGNVRFKGKRGRAFEFRFSPLVIDPPRALDVINEIVGIPIPIRGADTLLFGGLRPSADESLVVNVSGAAGTGKTSFALAIAATLSPFGARCYYVTTEEAREDLEARLKSLIPAYMRDLSIHRANINDWFHVADLRELKPQVEGKQLGEGLSFHLAELGRLVQKARNDMAKRLRNRTSIPAIAPLVVVIDSIFGLTDGRDLKELKELADFIDRCRDLKALVFVLSGEELPKHSRLSYMVDVLLKLSYRDTESEARKPERLLQLVKTRFQLSRPGTHVFHMSGREGFRISPQLPSQLDKEEQRNLTLPDKDQVINVLNDWSDGVPVDSQRYSPDKECSNRYLDLYAYSHVLIHGHGSSGKAGVGLRVLASRIEKGETHKRVGVEPRRVLVVSFLYPPSYYEERFKRLTKDKSSKEIDPTSIIDCIAFSPGFLPPEDMVGKIARKLEEAELKGTPFTGVLLDGLHNVFLSFPVLQKNEMVWPTLYRMLSIKKQTIVTTHTTFMLDLMEQEDSPEEREIHREGQAILLHALVQAADFYLSIDRIPERSVQGPDCFLRVREFIGNQNLPQGILLWDRHAERFSKPVIPLKPKQAARGDEKE